MHGESWRERKEVRKVTREVSGGVSRMRDVTGMIVEEKVGQEIGKERVVWVKN